MVNSVTFPKKGKGYVYTKLSKPEAPNKHCERLYGTYGWTKERIAEEKRKKNFVSSFTTPFNQEKYDADVAKYEKELAYYNEHKNEYILPCHHLLIGRTFEFQPDKINVIFGPNGCGKTTIIKAIAGEGYCLAGFNKVADRWDPKIHLFDDKPVAQKLKTAIEDTKENTAEVEWSGNPMYYYNFSNVEARHGMEIGGLMGTGIFGEEIEEFAYMINRDRISAGQKTAWLFNKLANAVTVKHSLKSLLESQAGKNPDEYAKGSFEYFSKYPDYETVSPVTILLDELDKSLDIENVCKLYREVLPGFQKKFGVQIILVSHSPIFVMSGMRNDERYHIIDIDPEYSKECIEGIRALNG